VLTDFGCEHAFARAAESVWEHYGFEIGASAVRTATLKHAQRARAQLQAEYEQPFRVLPAVGDEQYHRPGRRDVDPHGAGRPKEGKRPRDWNEMRLVAAQAKDSTTTVYGATFGSVVRNRAALGALYPAGRLVALNSRIHALGDGAEWIRLQTQEVFGKQGHFLCDFFHVSEYLGAASPSCRPAQPDQWRRTQQKRLRRGDVPRGAGSLSRTSGTRRNAGRRSSGANGHRYPEQVAWSVWIILGHWKLGLPKWLRHDRKRTSPRDFRPRLKKAGAAWLSEHADQIAHLRVLRANPPLANAMELISPTFNHTPSFEP